MASLKDTLLSYERTVIREADRTRDSIERASARETGLHLLREARDTQRHREQMDGTWAAQRAQEQTRESLDAVQATLSEIRAELARVGDLIAHPRATQAKELVEQAHKHIRAGDFEEAERALRRARNLDATDPDMLLVFGYVLTVRESFDDAFDILGKSLGYRPSTNNLSTGAPLDQTVHIMSRIRKMQGQYEKALRILVAGRDGFGIHWGDLHWFDYLHLTLLVHGEEAALDVFDRYFEKKPYTAWRLLERPELRPLVPALQAYTARRIEITQTELRERLTDLRPRVEARHPLVDQVMRARRSVGADTPGPAETAFDNAFTEFTSVEHYIHGDFRDLLRRLEERRWFLSDAEKVARSDAPLLTELREWKKQRRSMWRWRIGCGIPLLFVFLAVCVSVVGSVVRKLTATPPEELIVEMLGQIPVGDLNEPAATNAVLGRRLVVLLRGNGGFDGPRSGAAPGIREPEAFLINALGRVSSTEDTDVALYMGVLLQSAGCSARSTCFGDDPDEPPTKTLRTISRTLDHDGPVDQATLAALDALDTQLGEFLPTQKGPMLEHARLLRDGIRAQRRLIERTLPGG